MKKYWSNVLPAMEKIKNEFEKFTNFSLDELMNFDRVVKLLYRPTDPASLGIVRALFGKFNNSAINYLNE